MNVVVVERGGSGSCSPGRLVVIVSHAAIYHTRRFHISQQGLDLKPRLSLFNRYHRIHWNHMLLVTIGVDLEGIQLSCSLAVHVKPSTMSSRAINKENIISQKP